MKIVGVNEIGYRVGEWNPASKYTDREVELVRMLRDQGMTYPAISEKMEMPYWTVSRICRHERRAGGKTHMKDLTKWRGTAFRHREWSVSKKKIDGMLEAYACKGHSVQDIARNFGVDEVAVRRNVILDAASQDGEVVVMNELKLFQFLPDEALISPSTFAALLDITVEAVMTRSRNHKNFPAPLKHDVGRYRYRVGDVRRYIASGDYVQRQGKKVYMRPFRPRTSVVHASVEQVQMTLFCE